MDILWEIGSLRFFEAAARLASFKHAAAELHVTPGAVSQRIQRLEAALGCKLFYRQPRQIVLTEEGQRFAAVIRRALSDIEKGAADLVKANGATEIRLRAGPSFALRWLVPRLGDFYARHPDIRLNVIGAYGYFDPAVRSFDLAIEHTKTPPKALRADLLMDEHIVPVCSPAYLDKVGGLAEPRDLQRCELLHDGDSGIAGAQQDGEWRYWLAQVGEAGVDSSRGQFFSLANMAIEAALAQQGIAMGRESLIGDLLATGQLVAPFRARVRSPLAYWLLYPEEMADRPAMQAVIRWLQAQADRAA